MSPSYLPISKLLFQSEIHMLLYIFQINCKYSLCEKLVSKALTNLMAHLYFYALNNLEHCDHSEIIAYNLLVDLLAEPCCHGEGFQHCTQISLYFVDIMYLGVWMLIDVK